MAKFPKYQPCKVDPDGSNTIFPVCVRRQNGYTKGFDTGNYNPPHSVGDVSATLVLSSVRGDFESEIIFYTKCRTGGQLVLNYDLEDPADNSIYGQFYVFDANGSTEYEFTDQSGQITHNMLHAPRPCCDSVVVYAYMSITGSEDPSGDPPFMACSWEFP